MAECCSTTFPPRVAVLILGIVNMMRYCAMIMLWVCVQLLSCVQLFETRWTVTHQAPLSLGFSRQEYLSGLPCPPPGDIPHPGIKPASLGSPALAGRFFTAEPPGDSKTSVPIIYSIKELAQTPLLCKVTSASLPSQWPLSVEFKCSFLLEEHAWVRDYSINLSEISTWRMYCLQTPQRLILVEHPLKSGSAGPTVCLF